MENNSQKLGLDGERAACAYLVGQGYRILEKNWRFGKYEVDIIAQKDGLIVFVEVKTRKNNTFGEPEVFVTRQKQKFLVTAANAYMISHELDEEARFDVVAVISANKQPAITHLEGAFYPVTE